MSSRLTSRSEILCLWHRTGARRAGVCAAVALLAMLAACGPASAQQEPESSTSGESSLDAPAPPSTPGRLLTPAESPLQIYRQAVVLTLTNAYQPDGIRWLGMQLSIRNPGSAAVTVNTLTSQLLVGEEVLSRAASDREVHNVLLIIRRHTINGRSQVSLEELQGASPIRVPAGGTAEAWLVFAKIPRTRDLAPMTLRLDTSLGKIDLELTRIENEGLTSRLERLGPSGRVGIVHIAGELNVLNVQHFAQMLTSYAEQGVSRLVVVFDSGSQIADDDTTEWLVDWRDADNSRLQFYPQWSGLIRDAVFVHVPGKSHETPEADDHFVHNEADAVQRVTRELILGLDPATLQREIRSGHPLFRRAILLNAGEEMANADCEVVLRFLKSTDPVFNEPKVRQAAIRSLRAAVSPLAVSALEDLVRNGSREEAALALRSLNESQRVAAQSLAIDLASDQTIQKRIGLPKMLRSIGVASDERWIPFLQTAFQDADPIVREAALQQLLRIGVEDRFSLLQAALADKHVPVRDCAFRAMVSKRSSAEYPLFVSETLKRVRSGLHDDRTLVALREIRDPAVLPQLLKWIDEKPSDSLTLVMAAVEIGGEAILEEMVTRFPRFSFDTQAYLLRVLSEARHPESRRLVEEGLLSESEDCRELCEAVLAEFGDAAAVTQLEKAIHTSEEGNQAGRAQELARHLGLMGTPEALQALERLKATGMKASLQRSGEIGWAIHLYNSPSNNWLQAANRLTQTDDLEGAIQLLDIALELESGSSQIYNSLGYVQLRLSRDAEARANFEKAHELAPDDHNPVTGLAICLAKAGKYDEAIRQATAFPLLSKHGSQPTYLYNVACVYGRALEQLLKELETPLRATKAKEYRRQAVSFLDHAIKQGFNQLTLFESDPDLTSLRDLPEFQAFAAKIKAKE